MEEALGQLVKIIQEVAPELWKIAQRQVYVNVARDMFTGIFFLLFLGFLFAVLRWLLAPENNTEAPQQTKEDYEFTYLITKFIAILLYIIVSWSMVMKALPLLNPDWYTIEVLRSLIK